MMLISKQLGSANHRREPMWVLDEGKRKNQILKARFIQQKTGKPSKGEEYEQIKREVKRWTWAVGKHPSWAQLPTVIAHAPLPVPAKPIWSQRTEGRADCKSLFSKYLFSFNKIQMLKIFEKRKSVIKCTCTIDTPCLFKTLKWYPVKKIK